MDGARTSPDPTDENNDGDDDIWSLFTTKIMCQALFIKYIPTFSNPERLRVLSPFDRNAQSIGN